MARSRGSICREAGRTIGTPEYSVKHPPIATLPLDPEAALVEGLAQDLLHMGNRMSERVTQEVAAVSSKHTGEKLSETFQTLARSTGVPLTIYEKSHRGKTVVKLSSMTGRQWRHFIHTIGPKLRESTGVLPENVKLKFAQLYEDFDAALSFAGTCAPEDADIVASQTRAWVKLFLKLGLKMAPYVHVFHIHLPMSVKLFGGQDRLSGELVEKKNDCLKRTHLRKTNRKNPQMTLRTQLRIEHHERERQLKELEQGRKRKARTQHPSVGEGNRQREKVRREEEDGERRQFTEEQSPYSQLSIPELKELIRTKTGKRTQKRSREALLDILRSVEHVGQDQSSGRSDCFQCKQERK